MLVRYKFGILCIAPKCMSIIIGDSQVLEEIFLHNMFNVDEGFDFKIGLSKCNLEIQGTKGLNIQFIDCSNNQGEKI